MIMNKEYENFLNKIISCINKGDYYSIKELSILEVDKIKKDSIKIKKDLSQIKKESKEKKDIKDLENSEIIDLVNRYLDYVFDKIDESEEFRQIPSIEEFIQKVL